VRAYTNPAAYERFMGRWSARLAPEFLRFAQVNDGQHVLDVGCGTGVLGRAAISFGLAVKVTGIDPSPDYLAFAARSVPSDRVRFQIGRAEVLPFADGMFDAALALLVLRDFRDPQLAVREMKGNPPRRHRCCVHLGFWRWSADALAATASSRCFGSG
jgi:SAM-dependent methyltransferase